MKNVINRPRLASRTNTHVVHMRHFTQERRLHIKLLNEQTNLRECLKHLLWVSPHTTRIAFGPNTFHCVHQWPYSICGHPDWSLCRWRDTTSATPENAELPVLPWTTRRHYSYRGMGTDLARSIWPLQNRNKSNLQLTITPTIEEQPIAIVRDHRHLGITLTSSHVQSLVSMASKRSGLLCLMSYQLPRAVTIRLFKSYLRPTMEYASAVWHGSLKEEDALSIERIQADVASCLLNVDWWTPKPTLLEQLDWPALWWRHEISSLTFFHKIIQRQLPPLTDCLFPFAHSVSNRSQRKPLQPLLPQTRSTRFTKSFFYRSALLWNSLPSCIQEIVIDQVSQGNWRPLDQIQIHHQH